MTIRGFIRRAFQYFDIDIHKITRDVSPFIDPETAALTTVSYNGKASRFLVADAGDVIQECHAEGRFYEQDLLNLLTRYFKAGGCFVDIGANVGNHVIFAAMHLDASSVIAVEPMRRQHAILSINVLLNELQGRVKVHKVALSNYEGFSRMLTPNSQNLGRSMIADGVYGEWVRLCHGDKILADNQVDFIKIDVEGHEMQTLAGLTRTISRCRPAMLIEVSDDNSADFTSWLKKNSYSVREQMRHYRENTEVLALPD